MKDKRTKEQILSLLDRAMAQEEKFSEKIKALEAQLAECQKRADNPRYELTESALSGSKVSFRLDYYRTEKKGPLKGIIEHLSRREHQSFSGDGFDAMQAFIGKYLPVKARTKAPLTPSAPIVAPSATEPVAEEAKIPEPTTLEESPTPPLLPGAASSAPGAARLSTRIRNLLSDMAPTEAPIESPAMAAAQRKASKITGAVFSILTKERNGLQVEIPTDGLDDFRGQACHASLWVEVLESGHRFQHTETCVPDEQPLRLPQQSLALAPGGYRLTASLHLMADPRKVYYKESRLVVVQE